MILVIVRFFQVKQNFREKNDELHKTSQPNTSYVFISLKQQVDSLHVSLINEWNELTFNRCR